MRMDITAIFDVRCFISEIREAIVVLTTLHKLKTLDNNVCSFYEV